MTEPIRIQQKRESVQIVRGRLCPLSILKVLDRPSLTGSVPLCAEPQCYQHDLILLFTSRICKKGLAWNARPTLTLIVLSIEPCACPPAGTRPQLFTEHRAFKGALCNFLHLQLYNFLHIQLYIVIILYYIILL